MNKVFITGITGQDGSYLAELYLNRGDKVIGMKRRSSTSTTNRISHLMTHPNLSIVEGDLTDPISVQTLVREWQPNYFINTAAMSHVGTSFEQPEYTLEVNSNGVLYILEAIRQFSPKTKFLNCGTSEQFGSQFSTRLVQVKGLCDGAPVESTLLKEERYQGLDTPMIPNSPYAVAKLAAYNFVDLYRRAYNLFAVSSVCFNHESPRRGAEFVTRKVTQYVANLFHNKKLGLKIDKLPLGNLDACRDWGHAKDYVCAMDLMLKQDSPKDYMICTGKSHSIRELCEYAFKYINEDYNDHVVIDRKFYRPCEVPFLKGDSEPIISELGWKPEYCFETLIQEMVDSDIKLLEGKVL